METKKLLFKWRRTLRSCLMALLMLFVVQGVWALDSEPTVTLTSADQLSFSTRSFSIY